LKTLSFIIVIIFISGCAWQDQHDQSLNQSLNMYQNNTFGQVINNNNSGIEGHVRGLVADMAVNMRSIDPSKAIAVTSFVFSNSNYESTNKLGYMLADTFMKELHQFGFITLDFKVTDFIRITPQGDFSLSRDYLDLQGEFTVDYVLVGTMTDYKAGYILQARIVNIKNKKILATGQSFITYKLVNNLAGRSDNRQKIQIMPKVSS